MREIATGGTDAAAVSAAKELLAQESPNDDEKARLETLPREELLAIYEEGLSELRRLFEEGDDDTPAHFTHSVGVSAPGLPSRDTRPENHPTTDTEPPQQSSAPSSPAPWDVDKNWVWRPDRQLGRVKHPITDADIKECMELCGDLPNYEAGRIRRSDALQRTRVWLLHRGRVK